MTWSWRLCFKFCIILANQIKTSEFIWFKFGIYIHTDMHIYVLYILCGVLVTVHDQQEPVDHVSPSGSCPRGHKLKGETDRPEKESRRFFFKHKLLTISAA